MKTRVIYFLIAPLLAVALFIVRPRNARAFVGNGGGGSGGGVTSCTGGGAVANQFLSALSSSCGATLSQPSFSNLSGNATSSQLPAITEIGTPTTASGSAETSQAISTVSGASGTLYLCAAAVSKPTAHVACPTNGVGTWTTIAQGGQQTDGTVQSQATLCACAASSCTSASYTFTWTGSAFGEGAEVAINGLNSPTTPINTFANANSSGAANLSPGSPSTGNYTTAALTIACLEGGGTTSAFISNPPPLLGVASLQNAALVAGLGVAYPSMAVATGATNMLMAIAGGQFN